jgi:hypothetical protein
MIAAGISLAIIATVNGLGTNVKTKFTSINTSLKKGAIKCPTLREAASASRPRTEAALASGVRTGSTKLIHVSQLGSYPASTARCSQHVLDWQPLVLCHGKANRSATKRERSERAAPAAIVANKC